MRGRGRVAMQPINKYSMLSIKKLGYPPTVHIHYYRVKSQDTNGRTNERTDGQTPGIEFGAF